MTNVLSAGPYTIRNICQWVFVIVKYSNMMSSHATEGMNGRN